MTQRPRFKPPSRSLHLRNTLALGGVEAFWGFGMNLTSVYSVLPVFLEAAGGGDRLLGWLAVAQAAGIGLPQVIATWWAKPWRRKGPFVLWAHVVSTLPFLALAIYLRVFGEASRPVVIVALQALFFMMIGLTAPVWIDYMGRILREEQRGKAFGLIFAAQAICGILGGFASAAFLEGRGLNPQSMSVLFGSMFVILNIGNACFAPCREHADTEAAPRPPLGRYLRDWAAGWKENPNLRRLILAQSCTRVFPVVLGFYAAHALRHGFEESAAAQLTVVQLIAQSAGNLAFGHVAARRGYRFVLSCGTGFLLLGHALMAMAMGYPLTPYFIAGCHGLFFGAEFIGRSNLVMNIAPDVARRGDYLSLMAVSTTPAMMLSSLLAGWGFSHFPAWTVLAVSGAIVAIGLWLLQGVQEPARALPPIPSTPPTPTAVAETDLRPEE